MVRRVPVRAFLGLGANLGAPPAQLREAIARLGRTDRVRVVRVAPIYRSKPLGPKDQPDYANTVVEIETDLEPEALLAALKSIEGDMGRTTTVRWGPREIDLDILLYGTEQIRTETLEIPHAGLKERRFVLAPLADLAPELVLAGTKETVRALLEALEDDPHSVWREA
jgi:2-amino-4-hydroxy-6-hydroxymethyldihydropteridine diphosphokinase